MCEKWQSISGYEERYEVSNLGNVRRKEHVTTHGCRLPQHVCKPKTTRKGYLLAQLYDGKGISKHYSIHSLVAAAFIGERPKTGRVCLNHKNGIKIDNRVENLEYVTHSENSRHALDKLGFKPPSGESHGRAKITDAQLTEIKRRAAMGESQNSIARAFDTGQQNISRWINKKSRIFHDPQ